MKDKTIDNNLYNNPNTALNKLGLLILFST